MNQDAILKISAQVAGANNIKSLSDGLQGLRRAAQLSNAELGRMQIAVNRAARETGNTVAGIKAHATALDRLRDRTQIGSNAYNRLGREADDLRGRLAQLTAAQEKLPRASANSLAGISQQISRMQQLRQEVDLGTKKFELYTAGIARLQAKMASATAVPAKMDWRAIGGAAGGSLLLGGGMQGAMGSLAGGMAASGSVAGMAAGAGVLGAGALAANSTRAALDEYASLRRIRTLTADSDALMAKIRELTVEQGNLSNSAEAGAAAYQILSSGFSKTDDVIKILKASTLGATGGFSDINTVADGATSIMNSFNLSADKAAKVVDQMVQTQNDGKIVVDQYAQSIGRLAPSFAVAGLSVEEMNAAISALTAKGAPVETTMSGLNQTIKSIIKPTEEAKKLAAALGIEFSVAGLQAKGLGGFLQDVMVKTKGSASALGVLFSDIDGFKAVVSLTNDGLKGYNKSLQNMDTLTGQAAKAAKQAVDPVKQFSNAWKDFSANAGRAYLPALVKTLELMTKIIQADQHWRRLTAVGSMLDKPAEPKGVPYKPGSPIIAKGFTYLSPYSVAGVVGQFDPNTGALIKPTMPSVKGAKVDPGWAEFVTRQQQGGGIRGNRMYAGTRPDDPAMRALVERTVGSGAGSGAGNGNAASAASKPPAYIDKAVLRDWLRSQGFDRTSGDFTNRGHRTPNHMLNAMDMGVLTGPYDVAVQKTAAMKRRLAATGAFGNQLFGPGDPGHKDHLHVPTPGGRVKVTPGLAKLLGLGGAEGMAGDIAEWRNQADDRADQEKKAQADQLAASRDLLATKQGLLRIAQATGPAEKLLAEFDAARAERMRDYADRLRAALSDDERRALLGAQLADAGAAEIQYREDLKKLTEEQLDIDRQRLENVFAMGDAIREFQSRDSASAGLSQGMKQYGESIGNVRDAIASLTVNGMGGLENSLVSLATTGSGNFRAFAASVLEDTSRMIVRQFVLKNIMQMLGFLSPSAAMPSMSQSFTGNYGLSTGFPQAPAFGPIGPAPAGLPGFAGGGYTGNGARSGGLDGRGGFVAMLHPQETVVDHAQGNGGGTGATVNLAVHVHPNGSVTSDSTGNGPARDLGNDLARMLVPIVGPMVDQRLGRHMQRGGLLNK